MTDGDVTVPLGLAAVRRAGTDPTLVTYSNMVGHALEAAEGPRPEGGRSRSSICAASCRSTSIPSPRRWAGPGGRSSRTRAGRSAASGRRSSRRCARRCPTGRRCARTGSARGRRRSVQPPARTGGGAGHRRPAWRRSPPRSSVIPAASSSALRPGEPLEGEPVPYSVISWNAMWARSPGPVNTCSSEPGMRRCTSRPYRVGHLPVDFARRDQRRHGDRPEAVERVVGLVAWKWPRMPCCDGG